MEKTEECPHLLLTQICLQAHSGIPQTPLAMGPFLRTSAHIFKELAIFHNQQQVFTLLLQYREVVERIPVHHEHIRQGSRRQHAEFARAIE
jgi:hypothetical protein